MIEVTHDVAFHCDGCRKRVYDDSAYCPDCYEKTKAENEHLLKENAQLKSLLQVYKIEYTEPTARAPILYPDFAKKHGIACAA
jgi:predicted amidophosphoribosyltransferase